jgi:Protein kinase domain
MSTPGQDPRTTDSISRYALPYPLAALYRLAYANHEASARFGFSLRLAEGVFRFLALTNLADGISSGAPTDRVNAWLQMLRAPGMGKLLGLFRSTTEYLVANAPPFVTETRDLLYDDWQKPAGRIVRVRNRWTHDEVQVTNLEARPLLEELAPSLRAVLMGVQFLGRYRLGMAQGLRAAGATFTYFWYTSRGLEETCEPVGLKAHAPVTDNLVMLLHPERGEALYLAPFIYWGLTSGDRAAHFAWLHGLEAGSDGEVVGRYRHPVLRQDAVRGLPDPSDPDDVTVTLKQYVDRRGDWPGRVRLQLTPESAAKLADPSHPAQIQDRYKVIGKLGEGAMGSVWEVDDEPLGRRCALKLLHANFVRSPQAVRRFLREGKVMAQIKHPGVVEIIDVGIGPDHVPYLVMALVQGEDLDHRVARVGAFPVDEAVGLVVQVLEAVAAIHEAGVVHRDVKPSNLMLSADGVRVLDFGIAAGPDGTRLTQTMDRMGTVDYMAPEQWQGHFSPRSDVYACGQVLFTLIEGRTRKGSGETLRQAATAAPRPVEEVYERATAVNSEDRYPSATAMAEALEAALELARGPAVPEAPAMKSSSGHGFLDAFQRAERSYPQPIARAVRNIVWSNRGDERAGPALYAVFGALETLLQYLVICATVRNGKQAGPTTVAGFRQILGGRATLAHWANVLVELAQELSAKGDQHLTLLFHQREVIYQLIRMRNEIVHQINYRDYDQSVSDALTRFGDLLNQLTCLEQEVLYITGLTRFWEPDSTTRMAVVAMGALPSLWQLVPCPDVEPGVYIKTPSGLLSLDPWAFAGKRPDEIMFFSGMRRDVPEFTSTLTGERVAETGRDYMTEVRKVFPAEGPGEET